MELSGPSVSTSRGQAVTKTTAVTAIGVAQLRRTLRRTISCEKNEVPGDTGMGC
jgi:hypothetical protein